MRIPSVVDEDVSTSAVHVSGSEKSGGIDISGNIDNVKAGCTGGKVDVVKWDAQRVTLVVTLLVAQLHVQGVTQMVILVAELDIQGGNTGDNDGGTVRRTGVDTGGNIIGGTVGHTQVTLRVAQLDVQGVTKVVTLLKAQLDVQGVPQMVTLLVAYIPFTLAHFI